MPLLVAPLLIAAGESGSGDVAMIELDPLIAPVVDNDRVTGVLQVRVTLMPGEPGFDARMQPLKPRVIEACLAAVVEEARVGVDLDRPVNATRLATRLQGAVDELRLGKVRVLVTEVSTRRG
ncbi:hypothetical protein [Bradyrhizobium sp.]|uniref:hypothetical protein n=1 Tax=Bradyrhizobium sp. TaxID=376 RepID=UPI0025BBBEB4|nr:hypothetical protein [Bradyrhizobium sp.]MCA3567960.1 hypothetical protein [Bradyrhizobium sp.]